MDGGTDTVLKVCARSVGVCFGSLDPYWILDNITGGRLLPVEVGHDDGDGQGDAEHPADGAQRTHELARSRQRRNIPVTCRQPSYNEKMKTHLLPLRNSFPFSHQKIPHLSQRIVPLFVSQKSAYSCVKFPSLTTLPSQT